MLKNYLKIALRNLSKHKGYSLINISGLAIGLSVFTLIILLVQFELSFDKFHENSERIYRVEQLMNHNGKIEASAGCPTPLSRALTNDYPEFETVSRVINGGSTVLSLDNQKKISIERSLLVDNSFLVIFSFPLLSGNRETGLATPHTVMISQDIAQVLFGEKNPVGEIVLDDHYGEVKISGVFPKVPANSHLQFDLLISVSTLESMNGPEMFEQWYDNWVPLYVLLHENRSFEEVNKKLRFALKTYQWEDSPHQLYLRPLSEIHLYSDVRNEPGTIGNIKNIYIFIAIAIFVLLIACLNFVNLSTARAANRAKEVAVRKVAGAHKLSLVKQFLGESMMITIIAMGIAVALVEIVLPQFNTIVNRQLQINYLGNWRFTIGLVSLTFLIGILAGLYPAFFLSSFQPVQVLKGTFSSATRNTILRKALVALQFFISIILICGSMVILQQVDFLLNKDLGYNSDQILTITVSNTTSQKKEVFRNEILQNPCILNVGMSDYIPHSSTNWTTISWEGATTDARLKINVNYVDKNLMATYGMEIVQGRGFAGAFTADVGNAVILNESATKAIGWNDPIGRRITYNVDYRSTSVGGATVVGVVKDFHFLSLHNAITPLMLRLYPEEMAGHTFSVKIAAQRIPETISFLQGKFQQIFPEAPFNYRFLSEDFQDMYVEERKTSRVITYSAILAIFVACLGLFGLTSFSIRQRTKEIGIRKVLGASEFGIASLLLWEVMNLLIVANIFAWPIAYWAMNSWLQNFAYQIDISIFSFLFAGTLALCIAMVTVGVQAIKASFANPVNALRYE